MTHSAHASGHTILIVAAENTDGLTIIDITDPEYPRYCFLPGHETPIKSPRMTPLSVKQYLGAYYKKEDKAGKQWKHCEEVFALFKDIPLLSARDIAKAWPDESRYNWNDFDDDEEEEEEAEEVEEDDDAEEQPARPPETRHAPHIMRYDWLANWRWDWMS